MTAVSTRVIWRLGLSLCGVVVMSGCMASSNGQTAASSDTLVEHRYVAFDVAPDGEHVVFSSAGADLYLLNLTTLTVSQLTKTDVLETTPAFSPSGKTVVYAASSGGKSGSHIFSLSLVSHRVTQLTFGTNVSDSMPRCSRDGTHIAFARAYRIRPYSMGGWTEDHYDACVMSSKGGAPQRITNQTYYQQSRPQFLSKGALIYGAGPMYPDTATYLFAADIASSRTKNLTPKPNTPMRCNVLGSDPNVSLNGREVVFISDRIKSFAYDLFLMNSDGTNQTPLNVTRISTYNQNPVFMPDARSVLFLAGTSSNIGSRPIFSLWQVNTDGRKPHQVAGSGLFTHPLTWKRGT